MAAALVFILIIGVALALMGGMDRDELPSGIRRIVAMTDNPNGVPATAAVLITPGFGTIEAPLWHKSWKLYVQNRAYFATHALAGRYEAYDAPDLSLACTPGAELPRVFIDSRLPLAQGAKIKLAGKALTVTSANATWHELPGKALAVITVAGASVALPYADGVGRFTAPDAGTEIAGLLAGVCAPKPITAPD